jgi:hypothetical protein
MSDSSSSQTAGAGGLMTDEDDAEVLAPSPVFDVVDLALSREEGARVEAVALASLAVVEAI